MRNWKNLCTINIDALFQRLKAEAPASGPWFDGQVVGIKSLEKMMKEISQAAGLSMIYINCQSFVYINT